MTETAVSHLKVIGCDRTARTSRYEDEAGFANVSSEFLFRLSSETMEIYLRPSVWNHCVNPLRNECIDKIHTTRRRTGSKGTKTHPTIYIPINSINRGLPKSERLKRLCVMLHSDKFQGSAKKDDAEYPTRQRSARSSPRWRRAITWRRGTVNTYQHQC